MSGIDHALWWTGAVIWGVSGTLAGASLLGWLGVQALDRFIKWRWGLAEFIAFVRAREERGETHRPRTRP